MGNSQCKYKDCDTISIVWQYCRDHRCVERNCGEARYSTKSECEWCPRHKCIINKCYNPGYPHNYCDQHRCNKYGCSNPKLEGDKYCHECDQDPKCIFEGCDKLVGKNQTLCYHHSCKICHKKTNDSISGLCSQHKCQEIKCFNPAIATNGSCKKHVTQKN